MVGLTENPDALQKWMVAAPELACMVKQFENSQLNQCNDESNLHHSETASAMKRFSCDMQRLLKTMINFGNPLLENSSYLYNISSKKVADLDVVNTVQKIEEIGKRQYREFANERLCKGSQHLKDPIKMNKFPLMSKPVPKTDNLKAQKSAMKNDCSLFGRLYIATALRGSGDVNTFFAHENQQFPPSLAKHWGEMRSGTKSDLVHTILDFCPDNTLPIEPPVNAKILDGSVIVHVLKPNKCLTFREYISNVFHSFLKRELVSIERLDLVWDVYMKSSLKNGIRKQRGSGIRTRVSLDTKIPTKWPDFLRNSEKQRRTFSSYSFQHIQFFWQQ